MVGLDLETYWNTEPVVFEKYIKAYQKKQELEVRGTDFTNFLLGKYIALAYNDPKKYPKKPFLHEEEEKNENMTEQEMDAVMRQNTLLLGGTIND